MPERADPDNTFFQHQLVFRWLFGFMPVLLLHRSPWRDALLWRYRWAARRCRGKAVLDIPCGMGWGTSILARAKPQRLVGIDYSTEAIADANQRYGRTAEFKIGDMRHIDFPSELFDTVVCLEGIEHITFQHAPIFLAEVSRVLKSGGELLLSSPYPKTSNHSGNQFHLHEYRPEEMRALLEKYFKVTEAFSRPCANLIVSYYRAVKTVS